MKILIVVDMQNDFIDGSLGSKQAQAVVSSVVNKIKNFDGGIIYTMDTHGSDYLETQEGRRLPVPHCAKNTNGWLLNPEIANAILSKPNQKDVKKCLKSTFGFKELPETIISLASPRKIDSIELVGVCTGICVLSNAILIKSSSALSEIPVIVDAKRCACVSDESHQTALKAMKLCQIEVI